MREQTLRNVLLVKAIEESDRSGEVIPFADRAAATREADRKGRGEATAGEEFDGGALPRAVQRLLVRRAEILREGLTKRFPIVETLGSLSFAPSWLRWTLLALSFVFGASLSVLDGTHRINILAFPLLGLIAWNILVYLWAIAGLLQRPTAGKSRGLLASVYGWAAASRARGLLSQSSLFNAPLSEALRRFLAEWREAATPLLIAHGKRLFHVCAATVAIGLVAGLYLRGVVWRYEAGWESTFLDVNNVRTFVGVLYGPASTVSGISLPDQEQLAVLRWEHGSGGGDAALWIHLIAITAALFVVLPRLAFAALATADAWRHALRAPLPESLVPYFRTAFGATTAAGTLGRGIASVRPYGYEPAKESVVGLEALLPKALGEGVAVDMRDPVRYGDEDAFVARLGERTVGIADTVVLLFSLAATPEDENHGTVLRAVRDWLADARSTAQLLVVVDEAPYAARLGGDPSLEARLEERRRAWIDFVKHVGLEACLVDLPAMASGDGPPAAVIDRTRDALWSVRPA